MNQMKNEESNPLEFIRDNFGEINSVDINYEKGEMNLQTQQQDKIFLNDKKKNVFITRKITLKIIVATVSDKIKFINKINSNSQDTEEFKSKKRKQPFKQVQKQKKAKIKSRIIEIGADSIESIDDSSSEERISESF